MSDNFHKYILRNSQISFLKNKFFLGSYPFCWGLTHFSGVDTHFYGVDTHILLGLIPIFWGRYPFSGVDTHIFLGSIPIYWVQYPYFTGSIPVFENLKTTITAKNIQTMYIYEYDCCNRYIQRSM